MKNQARKVRAILQVLILGSLFLGAFCLVAEAGTPPAIATQPSDKTLSSGQQNVQLSIRATGTATLCYQWYRIAPSAIVGFDIPGATMSSYTIPPPTPGDDGARYYCVVNNTYGSITSNSATLTVHDKPLIITQPSGQGVYKNTTATFSVVATGYPTLNYEWWKKRPSGLFDLISGANGPTYTTPIVTEMDNNTQFKCVVWNKAAATNTTAAVETRSVLLNVIIAPIISNQPATQNVNAGKLAMFSVTATGLPLPLSYQWYKVGENGASDTQLSNIPKGVMTSGISDATTRALRILNVQTQDAGQYYCKVSNAKQPTPDTTQSAIATLTISSAAPTVSTPAARTIKAEENAVFSVTATGIPVPTYQWYKASTGGAPDTALSNRLEGFRQSGISGATSRSLSISNAQPSDSGGYFCRATNIIGSTNGAAATLTVNSVPPNIKAQTFNKRVDDGDSVSFRVAAEGRPTISYQWYKVGSPDIELADTGDNRISGATTDTLTINPALDITDEGGYYCNVSNGIDTDVQSVFAKLDINVAPPTIIGGNNSYYPLQGSWGQDYADMWPLRMINATAAWNAGYKGNGVTVAVIDSGVDSTHPDLAANVVLGINILQSQDDDNDGTYEVTSTNTTDDYGHGTFIAGIIAAVENGNGIIGVAPEAKIMPIKWVDENGIGYNNNLAKAIRYAADNQVDIIHISWLNKRDNLNKALKDAVTYAYNRGCVIVAGAGDEAQEIDGSSFLLELPEILVVGSVGLKGQASDFSNKGNWLDRIDVLAPGGSSESRVINSYDYNYEEQNLNSDATNNKYEPADMRQVDILSLRAGIGDKFAGNDPVQLYYNISFGADVPKYVMRDIGSHYIRFCGTSAAAAYVSGVAALLKDYSNRNALSYTNNDIVNIICASAKADTIFPGVLNAGSALSFNKQNIGEFPPNNTDDRVTSRVYNYPVAAPTGLTSQKIDNYTPAKIRLRWVDNSTNETKFVVEMSQVIQVGPNKVPVCFEKIGEVGPNKTFINLDIQKGRIGKGIAITPLEGERYFYRVRAIHEATNDKNAGSEYSDPLFVEADLLGTPTYIDTYKTLGTPTNLNYTNLGYYGLTLTWITDDTDKQVEEEKFVIEMKQGDGSFYQLDKTSGTNITSKLVSGLKPGTRYAFRVYGRTKNGGFSNYSAPIEVITPRYEPPAGNIPVITSFIRDSANGKLSTSSATIAFTYAGNDATHFYLEKADGPYVPGATSFRQWNILQPNPNADEYYSIKATGLAVGSAYSFRIRPYNKQGGFDNPAAYSIIRDVEFGKDETF